MEETVVKLPSSVESVISNDDLLTEILARLPVLSLVWFKSVSKHWLSPIKDASVTFRRKLDPLSGLFLHKYSYNYYSESYSYDFVPLDIRIPICRFSLLTTKKNSVEIWWESVDILDSCNGLLLCCTYSGKLYVYNPSITNMFKLIPEPNQSISFYRNSDVGGLKMAFDPTKSPHYKLIYTETVYDDDDDDDDFWVRIHTYSSETGSWSLCGGQFLTGSLYNFRDGVYWNDAIYWTNIERKFVKLDIMNEHPVLTALQTPVTLHRKECRLFESRGCLLLVDEGDAHSQHITIYEKGNVYSEWSEWSVKYIVNLDEIIKPFPKMLSIRSTVLCVALEEREENSFLVMELDKKIVQYKFVSKTLSAISDLGPYDKLVSSFQFIPSFANV